MLYLTCTIISSVDLGHYGVFRAKERVSVESGTIVYCAYLKYCLGLYPGNTCQ